MCNGHNLCNRRYTYVLQLLYYICPAYALKHDVTRTGAFRIKLTKQADLQRLLYRHVPCTSYTTHHATVVRRRPGRNYSYCTQGLETHKQKIKRTVLD